MRRRKPYRPILHTQADVHEMWQRLIQPLGWSRHRLFFILVGPDGRPSPVVHDLDDLPQPFDRDNAEVFMAFVAQVADDLLPVVRLALLYCRPGSEPMSDGDRRACRHLYDAAQRHAVRLEVIHVATDVAIQPAPMDDVLAA